MFHTVVQHIRRIVFYSISCSFSEIDCVRQVNVAQKDQHTQNQQLYNTLNTCTQCTHVYRVYVYLQWMVQQNCFSPLNMTLCVYVCVDMYTYIHMRGTDKIQLLWTSSSYTHQSHGLPATVINIRRILANTSKREHLYWVHSYSTLLHTPKVLSAYYYTFCGDVGIIMFG